MTRKTLKRIEAMGYKSTIDFKRKDLEFFREINAKEQAVAVRGSIAGYIQALRDCGVITESERQVLCVYYTR